MVNLTIQRDHRNGTPEDRFYIQFSIGGQRSRIRRDLEGNLLRSASAAERLRRRLVAQLATGRPPHQVLNPYLSGAVAAAAVAGTVCRQDGWKVDAKRDLLEGARRRAKRDRIDFSIGASDIPIPDRCPALGIPLQPTQRGEGFASRWNSPTIDRIDPTLGYVPGNVVVISFRANSLKSNATPEDLRKLAEWVTYCELVGPQTQPEPGAAADDDAS